MIPKINDTFVIFSYTSERTTEDYQEGVVSYANLLLPVHSAVHINQFIFTIKLLL